MLRDLRKFSYLHCLYLGFCLLPAPLEPSEPHLAWSPWWIHTSLPTSYSEGSPNTDTVSLHGLSRVEWRGIIPLLCGWTMLLLPHVCMAGDAQGTSISHRAAPQPARVIYSPGAGICIVWELKSCEILQSQVVHKWQQLTISSGFSNERNGWLQAYAFKRDMQLCKNQMGGLGFSSPQKGLQKKKQYGSRNFLIKGCLLMVGLIF